MNKIQTARFLAHQNYVVGSDDTINIDDNAEAAVVDTGIWVQAWVFVSNNDIKIAMQDD